MLRKMSDNKTRYGSKKMYNLILVQDKGNFIRFKEVVGFSIKRKIDNLLKIVNTYSSKRGLLKITLKAQKKSSESANKIRTEEKLPKVLEGIRNLIRQGIKPTQRECAKIKGFYTIQRWYGQKELVDLARGLK